MPLITSDFEFSDDYPTIEPSLRLDFANARALDPRITFTRASVGTYVGASGLIKTAGVNEPRFDHDPTTGESLGLLIEESRTNFFENSETVGGTATGDFFRGKEIHNKSVNLNQFYFASDFANYNVSAGDKYYLTGFIRAGSQTGNIFIKWIDGLNAPVSGVNSFTYTPTTDGEFVSFEFTFSQAVSISMNCSITGGFGDDADFAIMQVEEGSFPTSYIPTSGSTVTRAVDNAVIQGESFSNFYNSTEGTFFAEADTINPRYNDAITGYDGNNNNYTIMGTGDSPNRFQLRFDDQEPFQSLTFGPNGSTAVAVNVNLTPTLDVKIAGTIKQDDARAYAKGVSILTDTSIDLINPVALYIGNLSGSSEYLNGHVKKLFYYPKALPNAQLQTLTQ